MTNPSVLDALVQIVRSIWFWLVVVVLAGAMAIVREMEICSRRKPGRRE